MNPSVRKERRLVLPGQPVVVALRSTVGDVHDQVRPSGSSRWQDRR
ncbi:MAG: hypothetical protein JNL97_03755 [Verrucomicrobiales bacterium]|nr:hypothetical protein [Verrucomicrobiales bacterium]